MKPTTGLALYALIAIYAAARVLQVFADQVPMLAIVLLHVLPPAVFGLIHGAARYGWRGIAVFFALCLGIGGFFEVLGVHTRFPFGPYYFTDLMGLAFGIKETKSWMSRHFVDPAPLLKRIGLCA